jgi:hypothetical protein
LHRKLYKETAPLRHRFLPPVAARHACPTFTSSSISAIFRRYYIPLGLLHSHARRARGATVPDEGVGGCPSVAKALLGRCSETGGCRFPYAPQSPRLENDHPMSATLNSYSRLIYIYIYIFLRTLNFIKTNYPHALNNNAETAETGDASSCMFPKIGWRPRSASKRKLLGRIIRCVRARFEAVRPEVMFKGGGALASTVVVLKRGGG